MTTDELRWYPSKIDWWLVPFLCLPPVAAVAVCVASALAGSITNLLVGVAVTALVVGLYFGLVFPIRYGINDTYSLDRLHVKFGQGFFKAVMISPSDRDVFLDDLTKQAGLKRVGDRLCRNRFVSARQGNDMQKLSRRTKAYRPWAALLRTPALPPQHAGPHWAVRLKDASDCQRSSRINWPSPSSFLPSYIWYTASS